MQRARGLGDRRPILILSGEQVPAGAPDSLLKACRRGEHIKEHLSSVRAFLDQSPNESRSFPLLAEAHQNPAALDPASCGALLSPREEVFPCTGLVCFRLGRGPPASGSL